MLIPFGAPPALPTRRNVPSERISAQALAWSEAQTRPSPPTTTSSGRLRPTPTFRRRSIGIGASTAALCGAGTTGWALREREAPPLEDQEPVRALPDDFVGDAGRELAVGRLRRLAPRQHALDEELGRRPRDPAHLGPRGPPRSWARSLEGLAFFARFFMAVCYTGWFPTATGSFTTPGRSRSRTSAERARRPRPGARAHGACGRTGGRRASRHARARRGRHPRA